MNQYAQSDDDTTKPHVIPITEPMSQMPAVWTHAWQRMISQQQQQISQLQTQHQNLRDQVRQLQAQLDRIKNSSRGFPSYE